MDPFPALATQAGAAVSEGKGGVCDLLVRGVRRVSTLHFETLIYRPALCNARACIYDGHSRAESFVEISHDEPALSRFLLGSGAKAFPVLGAKSGIDGINGDWARDIRL